MELTNKHYFGFLLILVFLLAFFSYEDNLTSAPLPVSHVEASEELPIVTTASHREQGNKQYLEITEGCVHGQDSCIWAYAGPGTDYKKVYQLEKGMLLNVKDTVTVEDRVWYHVYFDESLRYPERTPKDWYVPAIAGKVIHAGGVETLSGKVVTNKRIVVDISDQMLYAYDGDKEFLAVRVSTGEAPTLTPTGTFTIFKKIPTRYMQGPQPGVTDVAFDLPGVSWDMYFTEGGAAIHGTYWHNNYGTQQSDGCVNLPPELAKMLYDWAPVGAVVTIQD